MYCICGFAEVLSFRRKCGPPIANPQICKSANFLSMQICGFSIYECPSPLRPTSEQDFFPKSALAKVITLT